MLTSKQTSIEEMNNIRLHTRYLTHQTWGCIRIFYFPHATLAFIASSHDIFDKSTSSLPLTKIVILSRLFRPPTRRKNERQNNAKQHEECTTWTKPHAGVMKFHKTSWRDVFSLKVEEMRSRNRYMFNLLSVNRKYKYLRWKRNSNIIFLANLIKKIKEQGE